MDSAMIATRVLLDALVDDQGQPLAFDAWVRDGERWNGWACPHFDRAEADRLLAAQRAAGFVGRYDAERDAYVFPYGFDDPDYDPTDPQWSGEPDWVFEAVELDGRHLYPIGSWAWTWEFVEQPGALT